MASECMSGHASVVTVTCPVKSVDPAESHICTLESSVMHVSMCTGSRVQCKALLLEILLTDQ